MNDIPAGWLEGLDVLLAAARTGSATRAASALGTTAATVLRRLSGLEAALGAPLFDRTPGGLLAAPALELVLPWAEQAEEACARMRSQVAGLEREPVGNVRLALVPGVSSFVVAPALPALRRRHPRLTLELLSSTAVVDLVRREADLALRIIRPAAGDLVVQRLATFRLAVMCAPELLAGGRRPRLASLPWLTWTDDLDDTPEASWLRAHVPGAEVALRSSELQTLVRAAQAGCGALLVAESLGRAAGGLVTVPVPGVTMPEGALWLAAHRALRPVPRVAAVWEWLVELFQQLAQLEPWSGSSRPLTVEPAAAPRPEPAAAKLDPAPRPAPPRRTSPPAGPAGRGTGRSGRRGPRARGARRRG